ncbi:MAG: protein-L-isoaspartate(D-aspartate) O-methyltransferase [Candidatus Micrarchaeales archaeon]|jgi:protein-L-isoaspartate(D-aspartate) O-methyltransferase
MFIEEMQMADLNKENIAFVNILSEAGAIKSKKLFDAFVHVPRHLFVRESDEDSAYIDMPLSIGENSTISQPSTVAIMLEALELENGNKVLEMGTGSGWNAALMGYCIGTKGKVITLEIEEEIAEFAKKNILKLNIMNVLVLCKDGSNGYADEAPYDRIIYTAATKEVPASVLAQLNVSGILLAPVGTGFVQLLTKIKKLDKNRFDKMELGYFQFVPLRSPGM